jgi:uncharacterized protein (DUF486 family)
MRIVAVSTGFSAGTVNAGSIVRGRFSDHLVQLNCNGRNPIYLPDVAARVLERNDMPTISPRLLPVLLLFASNVFMTFAWYGHLKFKQSPLSLVIMASWGIAFFEYWLAVPANRWASAVYSAAQLKTMQEVITLVVFAGFSVFYLKEPLGWNHGLGFALIAAGAFFIFQKW